MVVEVPGGIRLLGSSAKHHPDRSKGLVIMLHGWEGSIDSTYMLCSGRFLFDNNFRVEIQTRIESQILVCGTGVTI